MSEQFEEFEIEDALAAAQRVSGSVKNADNYDELAAAIAHRYALRSDFNRAVETADTMNDPFAMEESIAGIAAMLAAEGRDADAFELVESLEELSHKATAKSKIAVIYATRGEFGRALEIASGMDDNAATLVEIAYQFADKGQYEQALEITDELDFPLGAAWVRIRIAQEYSKAGRADEALELLSQTIGESEEIDPLNERVGTLSEVAVRFFEMGKLDEAKDALSQAVSIAGGADEIYKDASLAHLATSNARMKHYDDAVSTTEAIESIHQATATLIELAVIEHEEDSRGSEALQLLSDAFDLIVDVEPETQRDEAQRHYLLARIALVNANFGEADRALKVAQSIGEPDERNQVLANVAVRLAEVVKYDEARDAIRVISDDSYKANALVRVFQVAAAAGALEYGTECLDEASRLAEHLERPLERVQTLMELAGACKAGEEEESLPTLFTQALGETKLITNEFQKVSALLSIADACEKTNYEMDEEFKEVLWEIAAG